MLINACIHASTPVFMHVHLMRDRMNESIHKNKNTSMHVCMYTCSSVDMGKCMPCMHVWVHACINGWMGLHMDVCKYAWVHICMRKYIHNECLNVYAFSFMHVSMHTYICMHSTYMHVCMCTYIHEQSVSILACTHACMYTCVVLDLCMYVSILS